MFGSVTVGSSAIPTVVLASADGQHSCTIFTFGATVLSWVCGGNERLFVSKAAILDGSKAVRGGIPLVFPQFGQPNPSMAQHGFARNQVWELAGSFGDSESISAVLRIKSNDATRALWPHDFCLLYQVTLTSHSLVTSFVVQNSAAEDIDFQCLQHTYLRIPHITNCTVGGLQGREYVDKMRELAVFREEDESIHFAQETDRVYVARPPSADFPSSVVQVDDRTQGRVATSSSSVRRVVINDSEQLLLQQGQFNGDAAAPWKELFARWSETGPSHDVDVVVWNPWEAKAKALVDLNDDGYFDFVCVEPGVVSQPTSLSPSSVLILTQVLDVDP